MAAFLSGSGLLTYNMIQKIQAGCPNDSPIDVTEKVKQVANVFATENQCVFSSSDITTFYDITRVITSFLQQLLTLKLTCKSK